MFSGLGFVPLVLIFLIAAVAVWFAGIQLSGSTDVLDTRLRLGEALGGAVLLAVATNLPEIAITASAALSHNLGIAIGNILGGIAIQTVVLVALDVAMGPESALTTRAASLVLALEGLLVILVLAISVMGVQLPASRPYARLEPAALVIAVCWLVGVWLVESGPARSAVARLLGHGTRRPGEAARTLQADRRRKDEPRPCRDRLRAGRCRYARRWHRA